MATMAAKNVPLTGAASDLGLADAFSAQIEDRLAQERRRRKLLGLNARGAAAQALGLETGPAMSPAGNMLGGVS